MVAALNCCVATWNVNPPLNVVDYQKDTYHNDRCMANRIVPFRPKPAKAPNPAAKAYEDRVHWLAADSKNIRFDSPHFQQQLRARDISMRQVLETLRHGSVTSGPTKDEWGDMRVKMQRKVAGRRVQVVVAVKEDHLVAVTAI